ncbi:hypothetical protein [Cohnella fermenti]|uniref:Uncharacterized protein n=1 Tax=Cohnella fermenti TaxID=2565925 RepID=A0A4S4BYR9_9BACL|nr:hypothetical protein [Cohnella fermenti]THF78317.1 hypothetical protein E6C55_13920 [Cohnella fermenti]
MESLSTVEISLAAMDWRSEFDLERLGASIESQQIPQCSIDRMTTLGYTQLRSLQDELADLVGELEQFLEHRGIRVIRTIAAA